MFLRKHLIPVAKDPQELPKSLNSKPTAAVATQAVRTKTTAVVATQTVLTARPETNLKRSAEREDVLPLKKRFLACSA